jgi:uncharacterized FlaG/YvyC family protein
MITSIGGASEGMAASPPAQADTVTKVVVRDHSTQAPAPKPVEAKPVENQPKSVAAAVEEAVKEKQTAASSLQDINLRFRVDQKTQDVTVFLLNQQTREVIRTIPPNELSKLKPGDLVNLFA